MKAAIFDMDGTLLPGALALDLACALADHFPVDLNAITAVLAAYRADALSYQQMALDTHRLLQRTFQDLPAAAVAALSQQVWQRSRTRLFAYVRPALELLGRHGYQLWLISGSPAEIIQWAARDLGFHRWSATRLEIRDGHYTGTLLAAPAMAGGKHQALGELLEELLAQGQPWPLTGPGKSAMADWVAVGNSSAESDLFELVGHPLVFEPEPSLLLTACLRTWPVIDRTDALTTITAITQLHPERPLLP
ncbi:HAD family phosphatase [Streptomyces sp. I05A-00742]|uniref:HAD family hydrolase n=1 Tax=Streptomyces sp. I05A-00742 TaxID=2732853 RepID=UPI001488845A|nr:HAD-IB family phosphatase [Streptomyces sp. I05A-00742]